MDRRGQVGCGDWLNVNAARYVKILSFETVEQRCKTGESVRMLSTRSAPHVSLREQCDAIDTRMRGYLEYKCTQKKQLK